MATAVFDKLAAAYDDEWTNSTTGRLQRNAVWRHIAPLYRPGEIILDLGCGTGEDALHLMNAGIRVQALDASPEMIRIARGRGVAARCVAIEELKNIEGPFDGALSNFGALNCVAAIEKLRAPLAKLIRPGGKFAACLMGRFCLRETIHFLRWGKFRKAARRWWGVNRSASLGLNVYYPAVARIKRALAPDFVLSGDAGIGLCVPPSYIKGGSDKALSRLAAIDRKLAHLPVFRGLSDHRLLTFVRAPK